MIELIDEYLDNPYLDPNLQRRIEAGKAVLRRVQKRNARKVETEIMYQGAALRSISEPIAPSPPTKPKHLKPSSNKLEMVWKHPCRSSVSLFGTFTDPAWIEEIRMYRDQKDGYYKVDLSERGISPGTYLFKFVVDGEWRIDPTLPTRQDLNGHMNNTMFVRSTLRPLKSVRSAPAVDPTFGSSSSFLPPSVSRRYQRFVSLSRCSTPTLQSIFSSRSTVYRTTADISSQRQSSGLGLLSGAWMIPHPEKVSTGGADSFYFSKKSAGVADGVGEWEWRFRLDPRKFAEQLMKGCLNASKTVCDAATDVEQRSVQVLEEGYEFASAFGSSTACIGILDSVGERIGVANLGDSGFLHYRKHGLTMTCVMKTREQQHAFNMPYQLSRLPEPHLYDELANDPLYEELVKTIRTLSGRQLSKIDKPVDCDLYSSRIQEGDLLIFATDGVLDNLWSYDILSIVGDVAESSPFESRINFVESGPTNPEEIAKAIAMAAFDKSNIESGYKSPFGVECRKRTGAVHMGGKMDDITVVACWVIREEDLEQSLVDSVIAGREQELVCREWWRTRGGRVRRTSTDDARRSSKYEKFMSNEPGPSM